MFLCCSVPIISILCCSGQTTFLTSNFTDLASLETNVDVTLLSPFVLHSFDSVSLSYLRTCYQTFVPGVNSSTLS